MTPDAWAQVKALFEELVDLPDAERASALAQWSVTAPAVAAEVAALLAAAGAVGERFEAGAALPPPVPPTMVGERLGPYRITRELGRGGMGTVYEAERVDDQYSKRVAIKMVTMTGDRRQALRRFQRERELLAGLTHRNIATLLDGGVSPFGEPYFIMEYIEGQPITEWSSAQGLDLRGRVALFRQACAAVQHAHERLVIHRDLKPGNVLVDAEGTVKLLDFGIAKLLDPSGEDEDLTRTGAIPMTAAYASPEQLRGQRMSTSSDIYSLGVLLHELLTGSRPFPGEDHVEALLLDRVPPPPSRAAAAGGATRTARQLAGELDAILLKALRPEPERRYRSAQELGDDLHRWLTGQAVAAQPDTLGYRLQTLVRRNRAASAAAAAAVLALVGGTIVSTSQARTARLERDRAVLEQARTLQVTQFFQDVLAGAKPQEGGLNLTVVDAIDRTIPRIDATFANQPDLRAAIKATLGSTLTDMGLYERARPLVEDALRLQDSLDGTTPTRARADARYNLAGLAAERGELGRAESLYREAITMYGVVPGVDSVEIYQGMNNLANAVMGAGRFEEAAAIYAEVDGRLRSLNPADTVARAVALTNHGTALAQIGRYAEAEPLLREATALFTAASGSTLSRVASARQPLAGALLFQGKYAEAESEARLAWTESRTALGAVNPATLSAQRMLINVLADADRCEEAIPLARDIVTQPRHVIPAYDLSLNTAMLFLGWCEMRLGRPEVGVRWAREGLRLRREMLPEGHWAIAWGESQLGEVLAALGPAERAEAGTLLARGLDGMRSALDPGHVRVRQAEARWQRFEEAVPPPER
jgi:serine/threonine-protein kinase